MSNWKIKNKAETKDVDLDIHPIALSLLCQRGINTKEKIEAFLNPDYDRDIHDPFLFSDMEKAADRIKEAGDKKEKVVIFGDYDADGVTSTVILKETLEELGIRPEVYIPDKKLEGYGLNMEAIESFGKSGVSLIITVDCGITSLIEISEAKKQGIDVIVSDHHHVPENLPPALAIINPQMENCRYPSRNLAGVGVAFKIAQALYKKFLPEKSEQTKWMLDLAAIGTIADCVPLENENRALARFGLLVLSKTRCVGLKELFSVGRIIIDEDNYPDARKVAFQIAPRLNAAGRMDHANTAFNLLVEKDPVLARGLALEIEASNQKRQKETERITEEIKILADNAFKNKKFIFAVNEHFPIGIAGLVAGKIADEFHKPAAVFQKEEKVSRGSFRSIPELNIIELLEKCKDLTLKCGGHSQAAGVAVENKNLEKFYEKLDGLIEKELEGKEYCPAIEIDLEISADGIDFELAEIISQFEPFGERNEEPVFLARDMIIQEIKTVGSTGKHIKLFLRPAGDSPKIFEAIGFGLNGKFNYLKEGDRVDAVFNLQLDNWNGNKKIQLKLIDCAAILPRSSAAVR